MHAEIILALEFFARSAYAFCKLAQVRELKF